MIWGPCLAMWCGLAACEDLDTSGATGFGFDGSAAGFEASAPGDGSAAEDAQGGPGDGAARSADGAATDGASSDAAATDAATNDAGVIVDAAALDAGADAAVVQAGNGQLAIICLDAVPVQ